MRDDHGADRLGGPAGSRDLHRKAARHLRRLDRCAQHDLVHVDQVLAEALDVDLGPVGGGIRLERPHHLGHRPEGALSRLHGAVTHRVMHLVHALRHGAVWHLAVLHLAVLHLTRLHRLRALGPDAAGDERGAQRRRSESDHERAFHGFLLSGRVNGDSMPTGTREVCDLGHVRAPPRAASARRPGSRMTMRARLRVIAPARSSWERARETSSRTVPRRPASCSCVSATSTTVPGATGTPDAAALASRWRARRSVTWRKARSSTRPAKRRTRFAMASSMASATAG